MYRIILDYLKIILCRGIDILETLLINKLNLKSIFLRMIGNSDYLRRIPRFKTNHCKVNI